MRLFFTFYNLKPVRIGISVMNWYELFTNRKHWYEIVFTDVKNS